MKIEVTASEMEALRSGFLLKKVAIGRSPKKGDQLWAYTTIDALELDLENCKVYHKEMIGCGVPKVYRLIFGRRF